MKILQQIMEYKEKEVAERKALYPEKLLERSPYFEGQTLSLKQQFLRQDKTGIIAEFKRRSPSKGLINGDASVERTTIGYRLAGATALSILTDSHFFGGSNHDLEIARQFNLCPILRKDFTHDTYQIVEAKAIGADAILLIAALLSPKRLQLLADFAHSLRLEVLMEVHSLEELQTHLCQEIDIVGVNNRNLNTFEVNVETSLLLAPHIPNEFVKISESGISNPTTITELRAIGFQGFLIGEHFMRDAQPEISASRFIGQLNKISNTPSHA